MSNYHKLKQTKNLSQSVLYKKTLCRVLYMYIFKVFLPPTPALPTFHSLSSTPPDRPHWFYQHLPYAFGPMHLYEIILEFESCS